MARISNIDLKRFRQFLRHIGCVQVRTSGGHEIWERNDLARPIVLQTHVKPVPEFVVKNALRTLGMSREEFFEILDTL